MFEEHFELMRELIDEVRALRREFERLSQHGPATDSPLSREEAAKYLGIHKDTLYRWAVEEGRIAYSRLGDGGRAALRFAKQDLDDFLKRQRISTVEETRFRRTG